MQKQHRRKKRRAAPKTVLWLPDLDRAKSAVLNSLTSADAADVLRRIADCRSSVLTRSWHTACEGLKKIGIRLGNWLVPDQAIALLEAPDPETMKRKRDLASLAILVACGLRRHEAVQLNVSGLQQREDHWATVDLIGKASHVRTIPLRHWVKDLIDDWLQSAGISSGRGSGLSGKAAWHVVRLYAREARIEKLAPRDLRETCWPALHQAGGELDQIQFLLGQYRCRQPIDILAANSGSATPIHD